MTKGKERRWLRVRGLARVSLDQRTRVKARTRARRPSPKARDADPKAADPPISQPSGKADLPPAKA